MANLVNFSYDPSNFSYYDYYEDKICDTSEVMKFGSIAITIFLSVVVTLSLTGNILVLIILALYEKPKSLTNIFILNLAIPDLVFTIGLPFWAIYHVQGWVFSDILCKVVTFIFFIWIISTGAAMPSLLFTSITKVHHSDRQTQGCEYSHPLWETVGVIQQNGFFLFAFAVMTFCYIKIMERTRSHTKNRAVKFVLCRMAMLVIAWVPYNIVTFFGGVACSFGATIK